MPELDTITAAKHPMTVGVLVTQLRALGIRPGDTLIVHTAMSRIGWVCGREPAVVEALMRAVGLTGTLVMPAHSGDNSEPSDWGNPPVPDDWYPIIRQTMPAYNRRVTPTRCMGRVAECFRTWPGTRRSAHPHVSWCARGPFAALLLRGHRWNRPAFGMQSPLGRLYRRNAKVLLLGVGYGNCTALHMAETLCPDTPKMRVAAAVKAHGRRVWKSWEDVVFDSDRFPALGEAYEQAGGTVTAGLLGAAPCKVVRVKPLVDFGVTWLKEHPPEPDAQQAADAGAAAAEPTETPVA